MTKQSDKVVPAAVPCDVDAELAKAQQELIDTPVEELTALEWKESFEQAWECYQDMATIWDETANDLTTALTLIEELERQMNVIHEYSIGNDDYVGELIGDAFRSIEAYREAANFKKQDYTKNPLIKLGDVNLLDEEVE